MNFNNETVAHEGRARKSQSTKTSKKLQLWTNQSKTKYAISFENDLSYLAKTDPETPEALTHEYDTMVAPLGEKLPIPLAEQGNLGYCLR